MTTRTIRLSWVLAVVLTVFLRPDAALAGQAEQKAALELVQMVVPREIYDSMVKQMVDAMMPSLRQTGAKLPDDFEGRLRSAVLEIMPYDEVLAWSADIYASRFSVEELKAIGAFYKTDVGKKLARLMPELGAEIGRKTGQLLPQRLPAALKKFGLLTDDELEADAPPAPAKPAPAPDSKKK